MEQTIKPVRQCHNRGIYLRRQRILTALLKVRRKVKSILKDGSKYLEKEDKVLFGEGFQKKVNEKVITKKKTKVLFREHTKPAKRHYSGYWNQNTSRPFQTSDSVAWDEGNHHLVTETPKLHQHTSFPAMVERPLMEKGGFIEGTEVRNQPQMIPSSSNS